MSYAYDADQLTDLEGLSYGYDANGNQKSRGSDTFTYDHENKLTRAVIGGPVAVLIIERDVVSALVTIPLGIFCRLLTHWWAWRVGGPGDPTRKR